MAKLSLKEVPGHVNVLMRFWNSVTSLSVAEIAKEADRPFHIALIGAPDHTALLAARLALETPIPRDSAHGPADITPYVSAYSEIAAAPRGSVVLQADPLTADEARLAEALAQIVVDRADVRLALARYVPAFRPAVATQLINDASFQNAKIAVVSALPGIIPFTDALLPATALGDMVLLTKNQGILLLKIAAAYGLPINLRDRTRELLPIVGSAFGWRAVARELIGLVPGGIGVVVKGAVAYAGTYTVGKTAAIYYSTGQTLSGPRMKLLYRDSYQGAIVRIRQLLRRGKPFEKATVADEPSTLLLTVSAPEAEVVKPAAENFSDNIDKPVKIGV